jgi:hypothetical protein
MIPLNFSKFSVMNLIITLHTITGTGSNVTATIFLFFLYYFIHPLGVY